MSLIAVSLWLTDGVLLSKFHISMFLSATTRRAQRISRGFTFLQVFH